MKKKFVGVLFSIACLMLLAVPTLANSNASEGIYVKSDSGIGKYYTIEEFSSLPVLDKIDLIDNAKNLYLYLPEMGVATLEEMNVAGDFTAAIMNNSSLGTSDLSAFLQGEFKATDGTILAVKKDTGEDRGVFEILSIE